MITRLVLENWRSHEKSEFDFGKGTNVLIGSMGAGKTSAMDSICFALFGTFPALNSKKLSLDEIIRNKPKQQSQAKVVLELTLGEDAYRIKRVIEFEKGVTNSELWKNDTLIESPQTKRVTEKICSLLKINYDLFSRAVYAEQNNIDYFLEIPKSQRKQKIDELLKISKFENARKNLSVIMKRISERVDEKIRFASNEEKTKEIPLIEEEIKIKTEKEAETSKKLTETLAEKSTAEDDYKRIYARKKEFEELDSKIKQGKGKEETLAKRTLEYGQVTETEEVSRQKLNELNDEKKCIKEQQQTKESLEKQSEKSKAIIDENTKRIQEDDEKLSKISVIEGLEQFEAELKKQIDEFGKKIEESRSSVKSLEMQKKEINEHIGDLHGFDKCPTCETQLDDAKKNHVIESRKAKVAEMEKEQEKTNLQIAEFEKYRNEAKAKQDQIGLEKDKAKERKWILEEKRSWKRN